MFTIFAYFNLQLNFNSLKVMFMHSQAQNINNFQFHKIKIYDDFIKK